MKRTKPNGKSIHTMAINLGFDGFDDINVSLITDNAGIVKLDSHIHIVIFSDNQSIRFVNEFNERVVIVGRGALTSNSDRCG